MIAHERLRDLLSYNARTGEFVWLKRPSEKCRDLVGRLAGCTWKTGRRLIKIDGRVYFASRLAWFYVLGRWPEGEVDHEDRNPGNDKWINLRSADAAQQMWNIGKRQTNQSGYIGVRQTPKGTWRADARFGNPKARRKKYLGTFKTAQEAAEAYDAFVSQNRGKFAVTNTGGYP